jgi:hypothetical protein
LSKSFWYLWKKLKIYGLSELLSEEEFKCGISAPVTPISRSGTHFFLLKLPQT